MLVERLFTIGGALCTIMGGLLIYGFLTSAPDLFGFIYSGALCFGLGLFLLRVGRQAKRHRRALLELGEGGPKGRPPSR